jgi:hypothetical protein
MNGAIPLADGERLAAPFILPRTCDLLMTPSTDAKSCTVMRRVRTASLCSAVGLIAADRLSERRDMRVGT